MYGWVVSYFRPEAQACPREKYMVERKVVKKPYYYLRWYIILTSSPIVCVILRLGIQGALRANETLPATVQREKNMVTLIGLQKSLMIACTIHF